MITENGLIFCLWGLVLISSIVEAIIRGFDKRSISYNSYITKVIRFTAWVGTFFISISWDVSDEKFSALVLISISCGLSLILALWWYARKRTFTVYGIQKNRLEDLIMEQLDQSGIMHALVKKAGDDTLLTTYGSNVIIKKYKEDSRIYFAGSKMFIRLKSIYDKDNPVKSIVELTFYNFYNTENFKKVKDSIFDKIEEVSAKKMGGKIGLVGSIVMLCMLVAWIVWRSKV